MKKRGIAHGVVGFLGMFFSFTWLFWLVLSLVSGMHEYIRPSER